MQFVYRQTPYHHSVYLFPFIPNGVVYTFLAYTQMDGCASYLTQGDLTSAGGFCKYMYYIYCPCIGITSETGIIKTAFKFIITAPFCPNQAIIIIILFVDEVNVLKSLVEIQGSFCMQKIIGNGELFIWLTERIVIRSLRMVGILSRSTKKS